jgi:hypothetical protein
MKDWIKSASREQLEINVHNDALIIADLRKRLYKLTGCGEFGKCDGMDGSCVECSYENNELWKRCIEFSHNN